MFQRSTIVWKLSTVYITIIVLACVVIMLHNMLVDEHFVLAIIITLIAVGLGVLATWFMVSRLLEQPMRTLIDGMSRIAQGDLDYRMSVTRKDEFSTVADSFNDMSSRIELLLCDLRETKNYLEGIVESSADIIITVNPAGMIQTFNTGAETALGYARAEVIDQPIEKLFADPQERDVAIARLKDSDNVVNYETRFLTKDGDVRDVILTLSKLRGPHGFPIGTFGISKDVTNEKNLQKQLIQSEKYVAIGQSFTAIQHTMKNMLNALPGGSYMVRKGIEKQDWDIVVDGWDIVADGISSIREFSKNLLMYVKDWEPELKPVSLGDIVSRVENVFTQTASDNGVVFKTQVPGDLPEIHCDSSLIQSAIMDIVSNALEACLSKEYEDGETPQIDLVVAHHRESDELAVEIRDNGPGMTEKIKAHIFTPFFSTKKKKGTGLGLALTLRIVNLHGATIDVDSEPGSWTEFRILLPIAGPRQNKGGS